jgi:hypothetical protein
LVAKGNKVAVKGEPSKQDKGTTDVE